MFQYRKNTMLKQGAAFQHSNFLYCNKTGYITGSIDHCYTEKSSTEITWPVEIFSI